MVLYAKSICLMQYTPPPQSQIHTESCPSGRRCSTRNAVSRKASRVRIPNSPPNPPQAVCRSRRVFMKRVPCCLHSLHYASYPFTTPRPTEYDFIGFCFFTLFFTVLFYITERAFFFVSIITRRQKEHLHLFIPLFACSNHIVCSSGFPVPKRKDQIGIVDDL